MGRDEAGAARLARLPRRTPVKETQEEVKPPSGLLNAFLGRAASLRSSARSASFLLSVIREIRMSDNILRRLRRVRAKLLKIYAETVALRAQVEEGALRRQMNEWQERRRVSRAPQSIHARRGLEQH